MILLVGCTSKGTTITDLLPNNPEVDFFTIQPIAISAVYSEYITEEDEKELLDMLSNIRVTKIEDQKIESFTNINIYFKNWNDFLQIPYEDENKNTIMIVTDSKYTYYRIDKNDFEKVVNFLTEIPTTYESTE